MAEAIVVEGLSKRYRLGSFTGDGMLRESIMNLFRRRAPEAADEDKSSTWALRDVSFRVAQGEIVGIIGRNGAGKSTLLKLLSRITQPTEGRITVEGRVAPLVEVGTGFHQELTGRENVFLNGSILGLRKREIEERFDDIVEFSGLEKFLDTPLKRYSSGMRMRLGFAVAAHLSTDILLVDEVLAVGDAEFQKKCLESLSDVGQSGRTVLFVSHNLEAVERLCPRTIWIDAGQIRRDGETAEVIGEYLSTVHEVHDGSIDLSDRSPRSGTGEARFTSLEFLDDAGCPKPAVRSGKPLKMRLGFEVLSAIRTPHFGVMIHSSLGTLIAHANTWSSGLEIPLLEEGRGRIDLRFEALDLVPGEYPLSLWIERQGEKQSFDLLEHAVRLTVHARTDEGSARLPTRRTGLVSFPCSWDLASSVDGAD
jgi:lipopolysaccharide transport system ATP-binding protein